MRTSPWRPLTIAAVLGFGVLAGCGSDDDGDDASTTEATTAAPATSVAPATTATTPSATTTAPVPVTMETAPPAEQPSGGATPPAEPPPEPAGGEQPAITVEGTTARARASDGSLAELWCDAARQGAYDQQLGDATTFVITVAGSDATTTCELPR